MNFVILALALVVVLLSLLVVGLLRSHAEILRALNDLGIDFEAEAGGAVRPTGGAMPGFVGAERPGADAAVLGDARDLIGVDALGDAMSVAVTQVPRTTLLAFLSSGCLTCHSFWEAFGDPAQRRAAAGGANVVAVTKGPEAESPALVAKLAQGDLLTIMSTEAWDDYSVPVAPYFILVDGATDRIVGEGSAATFDQLASLMSKAAADLAVVTGSTPAQVSRRDLLDAVTRAARVDHELAAAGIEPGDPSLYPEGGRP